jgi:cytidine deaminase
MSQFQFSYQIIPFSQLPTEIQELVKPATEAASQAYAPYSHFKVGAAVLLNNGTIITGCNHENASYPAGVCAERAALSSLNMHDKTKTVTAILITYKTQKNNTKPITPCGICRQTILEVQQWQNAPIKIYMCSPKEEKVLVVENAAHLIPFAFGSDYL